MKSHEDAGVHGFIYSNKFRYQNISRCFWRYFVWNFDPTKVTNGHFFWWPILKPEILPNLREIRLRSIHNFDFVSTKTFPHSVPSHLGRPLVIHVGLSLSSVFELVQSLSLTMRTQIMLDECSSVQSSGTQCISVNWDEVSSTIPYIHIQDNFLDRISVKLNQHR